MGTTLGIPSPLCRHCPGQPKTVVWAPQTLAVSTGLGKLKAMVEAAPWASPSYGLVSGMVTPGHSCCPTTPPQEQAFESSQKYKEGKFIIEMSHMVKENGWD